MASGGGKYATYIENKILPCLIKRDPLKRLTDVVLFNGTSNVHNYGQNSAAQYPQISVLMVPGILFDYSFMVLYIHLL